MRQILCSLLVIMSVNLCFAADGVLYKDALVICKVKKVSDAQTTHTKLDLPFTTYGQNVVCNGKDVTYSLDKLADGTEVLAKVDYRAEDEAIVKGYGTVTKKDDGYKKHYGVKKETALASFDPNNNTTVLYMGTDKDELADFTVRCNNTKEE